MKKKWLTYRESFFILGAGYRNLEESSYAGLVS